MGMLTLSRNIRSYKSATAANPSTNPKSPQIRVTHRARFEANTANHLSEFRMAWHSPDEMATRSDFLLRVAHFLAVAKAEVRVRPRYYSLPDPS